MQLRCGHTTTQRSWRLPQDFPSAGGQAGWHPPAVRARPRRQPEPPARSQAWLAGFGSCRVWPMSGVRLFLRRPPNSLSTCAAARATQLYPHLGKNSSQFCFYMRKGVSLGSQRSCCQKEERAREEVFKAINTGGNRLAVKEQEGVLAEASQQHQCRAGPDSCVGTGWLACSTLLCNIWTGSLVEKQRLVLQLPTPNRGLSAGLCCKKGSSAPAGGWWEGLKNCSQVPQAALWK